MSALFFLRWVDGRPTIEHIQRATAEAFGTTRKDLIGDRRHAAVTVPRQVAMFLALELTLHGTTAIGRALRRDHTTIGHAAGRTHCRLATDPALRAKVAELRRRLTPSAAIAPIGGEPEPVQLDFLPGPLFELAGAW